MKLKLLLYIITIAILGINCQKEDEKTLKLSIITRYGDQNTHFFSYINDFQYFNKKVYILDSRQLKISVFTLSGKFVAEIQFRHGKGPGEFSPLGLRSFVVTSDSELAVIDALKQRLEMVTFSGKFLRGVDLEFQPSQLLYNQAKFYVIGNHSKKSIWVYDSLCHLIDTLFTPFSPPSNIPPWFPTVTIEENGVYYIANPYDTEIYKMKDNTTLWKFSGSNLNLVEPPRIRRRKKAISLYQLRGWASNGLCLWSKYLLASTFSVDRKHPKPPHILVLERTTGKFILAQPFETLTVIKTFENGKYAFKPVYKPFPQLQRIKIHIEGI